MVVGKGYKQTEIGIIPEDWEVKKIGEISNICTGKKNNEDKVQNGKYPFFVRSQQVERINSYAFDGEAIIIPGEGNIGEIFHYINGKFDWHQRVYKISNFDDNYSAKYLFFYLKLFFGKYALINTVKATVDSLRLPTFQNFIIKSPKDKDEQTAIATVLSDMDEYILSLEQLIAKKKAIKQGAMQNLLTGKIRLKGFKGEWGEKRLSDILDYEQPTQYIVRNTKYIDAGIPVLTAGKTFILGYTNEMDNVYTNFPVIIFDDFTTSTKFVNFQFKVKSSAMKILKIKDKNYNIRLVYEIMQLIDFPLSDHQRYWISEYSNIIVRLPSVLEEQTAIATILSDMDAEIEALQAKLQKAKQVKQGAMQQLLTGKIRLSINNQIQSAEKKPKQANVHFKRSVWAAEIANRLCDEPTFGHVKMEKLLFLTENMCGIDIGSNYHRDAAGPYDNRAIRSIDSQLKKQNWFEAKRGDKGYRYIPMAKRGGHKDYFNKYYSDALPVFNKVINTLQSWDTEHCEIVATLYSAWKDLANTKEQYTDDDIINEVINNWHESKKRISEERWQKALDWMRKNDFAPIKI